MFYICIYIYIYIYREREREREKLLHKDQLHVSAFYNGIFRLRLKKNLVSSYTQLMWAVYSGEVRGEVDTRSRMCYVGWVVWVHGVLLTF